MLFRLSTPLLAAALGTPRAIRALVTHVASPKMATDISFLRAADAQALDVELMSTPGFSVDQLMELAGLSVASAVAKVYPPGRVLVIAGPGNNGGDGLVAARHLWHFGYQPTCLYPKPTPKPLYTNLVTQCEQLGIPFLDAPPSDESLSSDFDIIIDSIFGFSFSGAPRPPFDGILASLCRCSTPVVSVDIPSGWSVDEGDAAGTGLAPDMLVSLTAPKYGSRMFKGREHYLGGRFVPPHLAEKYGLVLPAYPGTEQCIRLEGLSGGGGGASTRLEGASEEA